MKDIIKRDLNTIWHPYTQMKLDSKLIPIVKAKDEFLYTEDGVEIIDAISSWWVNIHGHSHPEIVKAIADQAAQIDQIIFAGFTHPKAVELAESLLDILPKSQAKVFYSDNGSTAVEVALKMALQYNSNRGEGGKQRIVALDGAYHGDTFGAMAVSARGAFNKAFNDLLFDVVHIPFPFKGEESKSLDALELVLRTGDISAFIFEPLLQGASGMRMYSKDVLEEMLRLCSKYNTISIADEVMTGFGRTGKNFAVEYLENHEPDIMCLSKGITGGVMPLGVTTCKQHIYEAFYSSDRSDTFYHGHSFTANGLSCAASVASIKILKSKETRLSLKRIQNFNENLHLKLQNFKNVQNINYLGTVFSFEYNPDDSQVGYFNENRNMIYEFFLERNVLLRPLGNVIYVLPPYCISDESLNKIEEVILNFLRK